jgi:hypothetical protein
LLKQKVAILLGYFIYSKNHNEPPKVAQFAKKSPNLVALPGSAVEEHSTHYAKIEGSNPDNGGEETRKNL